MSTKLFVGSLPWAVNDDTLRSTFEAHGKVVSAKVITDKFTGQSKRFGFVEMKDKAAAETDEEGRELLTLMGMPFRK